MTAISRDLQKVVQRAIAFAGECRHEYATLEHLLLSLLEDKQVQEILLRCGVNLSSLSDDLNGYLNTELTQLVANFKGEVRPTSGFHRVIQRAMIHVQSAGKDEVTTANVLVTLFAERGSAAVVMLEDQNVTRFDIVNYLAHGMDNKENSGLFPDTVDNNQKNGAVSEKERLLQESTKALSKYCVNLTEQAAAGEIDPVIGREEEINRAMQVLCRRRKNNPLFVGESGVGKTAIAEGVAHVIANGDSPDTLADAEIYRLDMAQLIAGTRYRGDFEERVNDIVKALRIRKNAIVFIDEIHTVVGSGNTSGGAMDMANLLKPALQNGEVRCMGATTHAEYRKHFEKDRALARRFQKIDIAEPSLDLTVKILSGLKNRLEEHHEVQFTGSAIRNAARLSQRYIQGRFLPDKAIDVLDETGAYFRLHRSTNPESSGRRRRVNSRDIERTVATLARVPLHTLSQSEGAKLETLEADLRRMVFGQDQAVLAVTNAIKQSRAGLREGEKPIGNYLFCGPTGVGKTEVARQLAQCLGVDLIRFDMSEYMESHSVARLIGSPPGYVGHDHGGLLTESVNKTPHCVLLLDEIEKAHPSIFNVLLQVMDYGTLTDSSGRAVSFSSVILVMTSNVGAANIAKRSIGFTSSRHSSEAREAVERAFSPEFRNRLDEVIPFAPLSLPDIERVVDKLLMELEGRLSERNVEIHVDDEARSWIARVGFDPMLGARPLGRMIAEHIKKPLSDELLFGKVKDGGIVRIVLEQTAQQDSAKLQLICTPRSEIGRSRKNNSSSTIKRANLTKSAKQVASD